jgi:hypothetical protein
MRGPTGNASSPTPPTLWTCNRCRLHVRRFLARGGDRDGGASRPDSLPSHQRPQDAAGIARDPEKAATPASMPSRAANARQRAKKGIVPLIQQDRPSSAASDAEVDSGGGCADGSLCVFRHRRCGGMGVAMQNPTPCRILRHPPPAILLLESRSFSPLSPDPARTCKFIAGRLDNGMPRAYGNQSVFIDRKDETSGWWRRWDGAAECRKGNSSPSEGDAIGIILPPDDPIGKVETPRVNSRLMTYRGIGKSPVNSHQMTLSGEKEIPRVRRARR